MEHNDWFTVPLTALLGHKPDFKDNAPYAPGMFSLADPGGISGLLTMAGFQDVRTLPVDTSMVYGRDAATFILGTGPVRHNLGDADPYAIDQARTAHHGPAALRGIGRRPHARRLVGGHRHQARLIVHPNTSDPQVIEVKR